MVTRQFLPTQNLYRYELASTTRQDCAEWAQAVMADGDQWVLRLVKEKSPGVLEFMSIDIQDDSKRREMLRKISKKMTVKEIRKGDDTFYQINPTPAQLITLIDEGYFSGVELRKMK